ncbi:hypothetical protein PVAP13_1KG519504 [Panicum virgatum]|uniref:Uncharacterized protein n=1 Tax=Panicum virgatum TaxID=38727 RepID=A0A8T0XTA4_PANVG|nr:hypothetical protein PVAP13_1KG519504 [Panicum virgatum]
MRYTSGKSQQQCRKISKRSSPNVPQKIKASEKFHAAKPLAAEGQRGEFLTEASTRPKSSPFASTTERITPYKPPHRPRPASSPVSFRPHPRPQICSAASDTPSPPSLRRAPRRSRATTTTTTAPPHPTLPRPGSA